jgi:uncharacterized protein YuzE
MKSSNRGKAIDLSYDAESDVLYGTLYIPKQTAYQEKGNGVAIRIDPETGKKVGFIVVDYMKRINKGILKKIPYFKLELPKYNMSHPS